MSISLNYDQSFSFCGQNLSGISDISFKSEFGFGYTPILGAKAFGYHKIGPSIGTVDFSRSLIYADPVINYTGDSPCSGQFSYGNTLYGFESGYLTSYSVKCAVGQVPNVSSSISIFGEMKSGAANQDFVQHPDIFVPSQKSMVLSNDYGQTNRITSFEWLVSAPRQPRFTLEGGLFPAEIVSPVPLQVAANITFSVAGFSPLDLNKFVRYADSPSFTIIVKNRDLSQNLLTLPLNNAQIINQQIQTTVDSPLSVTLQYIGYLE